MSYIIRLFITTLILVISVYSFIISVDPYEKFGINAWGLKHKAVNSGREDKFIQIDRGQKKYDLFLLGSSRVQAFDPDYIEAKTTLKTYNYGVNNARPEDLLAITRHIIDKQNPKEIFVQIDFYMLNKSIQMHKRLKGSNLGKYLKQSSLTTEKNDLQFFDPSYFTLRALKDSVKILYLNKFSEFVPTRKKNGMRVEKMIQPGEVGLVKTYFEDEYNNYQFDTDRIKNLTSIRDICAKHKVKLTVSISPVHIEHLKMILEDPNLRRIFFEFKRHLVKIFGSVYDFNTSYTQEFESLYWYDSVHPSEKLSNVMSDILFSSLKEKRGFGAIIDLNNIESNINEFSY